MHSSSFDTDSNGKDGGEVLVAIASLVTEGRIPGDDLKNSKTKPKKFYEGPHSTLRKRVEEHKCDLSDSLCVRFEHDRKTVLNFWQRNIPLCIEVLLTCMCPNLDGKKKLESVNSSLLLEQWYFSISYRRNSSESSHTFNLNQLVSAIRSQLYFSQITAWLMTQDDTSSSISDSTASKFHKITRQNLRYRLTVPGETFERAKFTLTAIEHEFPATDIGNGCTIHVKFYSLPRMSSLPTITCPNCCNLENTNRKMDSKKPELILDGNYEKSTGEEKDILDDRMHLSCTLKGKHRCEDLEEFDDGFKRLCGKKSASASKHPKLKVDIRKALANPGKNEKRNISPNEEQKVKSVKLHHDEHTDKSKNDLNKGQLLLDAIERSGRNCSGLKTPEGQLVNNIINNNNEAKESMRDRHNCDKMSASDIYSIKAQSNKIISNYYCDSPIPTLRNKSSCSNGEKNIKEKASRRITFDDEDVDLNGKDLDENGKEKDGSGIDIPTVTEQKKFRKNLDSAASMVFHSRTGLPLTSSPAPVRRGKNCFDFDSSLNSVAAIKSALFSSSFSTDDESESESSIVSPCSPETYVLPKRDLKSPVKYRRKGQSANLLGSFEESVLNGRLEPVSTVHGFRAELAASGSFVPKHLVVPVTVFFYTLGDYDKVSSPYLGHINLGKKGYNVPKSGTVQVTLFNPLGTVVKMFVIMYDLSDMPANSQTFIRQRTLYMPTNCKDSNLEWGPKWLRYLIHLRFMSSKSGKIYLHSDIRMIIFRKSDVDTATAHDIEMSYELRSFTHMPVNPKYSPRK